MNFNSNTCIQHKWVKARARKQKKKKKNIKSNRNTNQVEKQKTNKRKLILNFFYLTYQPLKTMSITYT